MARRSEEASRENNPAAAGIERFFSLKGPREENNVRASFCCLCMCAPHLWSRAADCVACAAIGFRGTMTVPVPHDPEFEFVSLISKGLD